MQVFISLFIIVLCNSQPYISLYSTPNATNESSSTTFSIDISHDNLILVSGNYDNHVYIYHNSNNTFSHNQTTPTSQDDV